MAITIPNKYFIYNSEGITKKEITLNFQTHQDSTNYIIHRAYIAETSKLRQGSHTTKTRAEVKGGGKKPWRQKGTGRARAGSNRSPLWRGGGVIFGPKNRQYIKKVNKKEKILAMQSCLCNRNSNIVIAEDITSNLSKPSTQAVLRILNKWGIRISSKILIVTKNKNRDLYLSVRNVPNITMTLANQLSFRSLLSSKTIIISLDATPIIAKV